MTTPGYPTPGPAYSYTPATCYRHHGTEATVSCQRCCRPICAACMASAPVGFQCPECVAEGQSSMRMGQSTYGGKRSEDPRFTSMVIIGINVAVWLLIMLTGWDSSPWIRHLAQSRDGMCIKGGSGYYLSGSACEAMGATWFPGVSSGAPWQILTAAFTHVDVWHIGFNMFALYQLGPVVEQVLGRLRFLVIYLGSAFGGALMVSLAAGPYSWTLGASGAIFGLMAALLVMGMKQKAPLQSILIWIGINVAFTIFGGSGISWQGHLGGFLAGFALTGILVYAKLAQRKQALGLAIVVALVCAAAAIGVPIAL